MRENVYYGYRTAITRSGKWQFLSPVTNRVNTPTSCTTTTGAGENSDLLARKSCVLVCVITVSRPRVTP